MPMINRNYNKLLIKSLRAIVTFKFCNLLHVEIFSWQIQQILFVSQYIHKISLLTEFIYVITNTHNDKFATFCLPDITKVDPTILTKFSKNKDISLWRTIHKGLNLQGQCKNKLCPAYKKQVWTPLGYGIFHMSVEVCKSPCPQCKKPTKGNKKIGIHKCQLTGRGWKVIFNQDDQQTDDDEKNQKNQENEAQTQQNRIDDNEDNQQGEVEFPKLVSNSCEGFLKMNGVNGPFVQWRYMTLEIARVQ